MRYGSKMVCGVIADGGDSIGRISRLGFSLVDLSRPEGETDLPEMAPQFLDWDAVEAERMAQAIVA